MSLIITASDWGEKSSVFHAQVKQVLPEKHQYIALDWHESGKNQERSDFIDTRNGEKVLLDLAEVLLKQIEIGIRENKKVVIISKGRGSRIVEQVLTLITGLDRMYVKLHHIMLVPNFGEYKKAKWGKVAKGVLALGVTAISASLLPGKTKGIIGAIGIGTTSKYLKTHTIGDILSEDLDLEHFKFAVAERHILQHIDQMQIDLGKCKYYLSTADQNEIKNILNENLHFSFKTKFGEKSEDMVKILHNITK
ncbi:MAG: hypothetical protein INQ03_06130 [Candidatus Heimdallarchaeota archaeon]|nr:hypothetical protein [Candidatus Heimdallarchaeota archaeon]